MEASPAKVEQFCNRQFYDLVNSDSRLVCMQGGTRSGKTYAICQYICYLLTTSQKPLVISVVRKTLPAVKGTVMRDLLSILEQTNLLYQGNLNKSENTFRYGKHLLEFLSVDEPQKIRGRKRDIAFLNEANELTLEDYRQINMRTTERIIIDFNPSDPIHWIYEEVIPRDDCDTFISTYKDNKYLSLDLVHEIERMKDRDPDYWRVYGEGQRAFYSKRQIFSNWNFIKDDEFPDVDLEAEAVIGLDYGFSNDPTAALLVVRKADKLFVKEILYRTGMTNQDIAQFLKDKGLDQVLTFADSAEAKSIEEMRRLNILVKGATKGQGSINAGISLIKEFDVYVTESSKNLIKEYTNYYWEQLKDGTIINKPVDKMNHLTDALRYCVYSQYGKRSEFFVI